MGDMEQIRELVTRLLTSNANAQAAEDDRQRELIQQVLAGRPDAAAARAAPTFVWVGGGIGLFDQIYRLVGHLDQLLVILTKYINI